MRRDDLLIHACLQADRSTEHPPASPVTSPRVDMKQYYAVEVVRQIEETVEIIVEAGDEDSAHVAALEHLRSRGDEYQWLNPKRDMIVWRKRKVATPAIVDVEA